MSTTTAHKEPGRIPDLTLGWRLKMALGDMKAGDMADLLDVERSTISRWMNDRGAPPRPIYVKQWALITGVDAKWLQTGEIPHPGDPSRGEKYTAWDSNPEPTVSDTIRSEETNVIPMRRSRSERSSDPRHTGRPVPERDADILPFPTHRANARRRHAGAAS